MDFHRSEYVDGLWQLLEKVKVIFLNYTSSHVYNLNIKLANKALPSSDCEPVNSLATHSKNQWLFSRIISVMGDYEGFSFPGSILFPIRLLLDINTTYSHHLTTQKYCSNYASHFTP